MLYGKGPTGFERRWLERIEGRSERRKLLYKSSGNFGNCVRLQRCGAKQLIDLASQVAFEATQDLFLGEPLGCAPGCIGTCARVDPRRRLMAAMCSAQFAALSLPRLSL